MDATQSPPVVTKTFPLGTTFDAPLGFTLSYATDDLLVGTIQGDSTATPPTSDQVFTLNVTTGVTAQPVDGGAAFVLGAVLCTTGCTNQCVLADAQMNKLRVFNVTGGKLVEGAPLSVDPALGLPPRALGEI